MKILIYSQSFHPSIGGVETVVRELACGIARQSVQEPNTVASEVTVVTHTAGRTAEDDDFPFRVVRRPSLRQLLTLVRDTDLIHLAGPAMLPLVLGLLTRRPVVIEHHGFQAVCPNGQLFYLPKRSLCEGHYMARRYSKCLGCNSPESGWRQSAQMLLFTPFRRWLANRATLNITPTAWLGTVLQLPREKTVYHGLSLPDEGRNAAYVRPVFAFQGRLVSTKGVEVLLDAAKNLHAQGLDFQIKIIGDGPERLRLETQAKALGDAVQFLGSISDKDLSKAFSDVSAVVVPSLAGEVFGLVIVENMLRGKALIVSDLGPFKEIVGETSMIAAVGDANALALCMRHMIENPSLALSLGSAAQKRATELFGVDDMIQSHLPAYRDALN